MLWFFVPSDEEEVSEDPRPVPRKSKKKYGKIIQHFLILHLDLISWFTRARLMFGQVTEYPPAKTEG